MWGGDIESTCLIQLFSFSSEMISADFLAVPTLFSCKPWNMQSQVHAISWTSHHSDQENLVDLPVRHESALVAHIEAGTRSCGGVVKRSIHSSSFSYKFLRSIADDMWWISLIKQVERTLVLAALIPLFCPTIINSETPSCTSSNIHWDTSFWCLGNFFFTDSALKRVDGGKGTLAFLELFRESFFRFKFSITKSSALLSRPSWSTVPHQL